MLTAQKYVAGFGCTNKPGLTAQNPLPSASITDNRQVPVSAIAAEEFIIQNLDLLGSYPADLSAALTNRLQAQPVYYTSVLDGIALLRAFIPKASSYAPTHYGLLLQNDTVVGLIWIPGYTNRLEGDTIALAYDAETRPLMRKTLELNADRLLLVTTRHGHDRYFANCDFNEIERLIDGFEVFGVEVLDYLLILDGFNVSYAYEWQGEAALDEGVSSQELERHYVDFPGKINFPPASY